MLREYVEAMRALWTEEEASYDGEFVSFGPSWAYPKPAQAHVPLLIGAGGGPQTFRWISENADGWMTTPVETEIVEKIDDLREALGRPGPVRGARRTRPDRRRGPPPRTSRPGPRPGSTELIWGVPDADEDDVLASLDRLAGRLYV